MEYNEINQTFFAVKFDSIIARNPRIGRHRFNHVFKDLDDPATEAYVKNIAGAEVEIEFLTDDSVRNNKHKNVVIAGVVAQPLSYLTLSLQTTLKFQTYSKVTGNVVTPGAWIFHKRKRNVFLDLTN